MQKLENAGTGCYPVALQAPFDQLQNAVRWYRIQPRLEAGTSPGWGTFFFKALSSNRSDHASCTLRKDCTRGNACCKEKSNTCLRHCTSMDEVETVAWSGTYDENGLPHGKVPAGCRSGSRPRFLSSCLSLTRLYVQGKLSYPSRAAADEEDRPKDQYEGDLQAGLRQGSGIYTWASGASYTGQYIQNMREGQGVMQYPGGARYEGRVCTNHVWLGAQDRSQESTPTLGLINLKPLF